MDYIGGMDRIIKHHITPDIQNWQTPEINVESYDLEYTGAYIEKRNKRTDGNIGT